MEQSIIDQQQIRSERIARNAYLHTHGYFQPTRQERAEIDSYYANNKTVLPAQYGPASLAVEAAEVELQLTAVY